MLLNGLFSTFNIKSIYALFNIPGTAVATFVSQQMLSELRIIGFTVNVNVNWGRVNETNI